MKSEAKIKVKIKNNYDEISKNKDNPVLIALLRAKNDALNWVLEKNKRK